MCFRFSAASLLFKNASTFSTNTWSLSVAGIKRLLQGVSFKMAKRSNSIILVVKEHLPYALQLRDSLGSFILIANKQW
jgi:hypothetical protein